MSDIKSDASRGHPSVRFITESLGHDYDVLRNKLGDRKNPVISKFASVDTKMLFSLLSDLSKAMILSKGTSSHLYSSLNNILLTDVVGVIESYLVCDIKKIETILNCMNHITGQDIDENDDSDGEDNKGGDGEDNKGGDKDHESDNQSDDESDDEYLEWGHKKKVSFYKEISKYVPIGGDSDDAGLYVSSINLIISNNLLMLLLSGKYSTLDEIKDKFSLMYTKNNFNKIFNDCMIKIGKMSLLNIEGFETVVL